MRLQPTFLSLFFYLLVAAPANAITFIDTPGCYEISGIVSDIQSDRLLLLIQPKSRSETTLQIKLTGKTPTGLHKSSLIRLKVYIANKGRDQNLSIEAEASRIEILTAKSVARANWQWAGEAKDKKCE